MISTQHSAEKHIHEESIYFQSMLINSGSNLYIRVAVLRNNIFFSTENKHFLDKLTYTETKLWLN